MARSIPRAATVSHAIPATPKDWDAHAKEYWTNLKHDHLFTGTDFTLRYLRNSKARSHVDELFDKLHEAKTPQERNDLRINLWKAIHNEWVKETYHFKDGKDTFGVSWKERQREMIDLANSARGIDDIEAIWAKHMIDHMYASTKVIGKLRRGIAGYNQRIQPIPITFKTSLGLRFPPVHLHSNYFHEGLSQGLRVAQSKLAQSKITKPILRVFYENPRDAMTAITETLPVGQWALQKRLVDGKANLNYAEFKDSSLIYDSIHADLSARITARADAVTAAEKARLDSMSKKKREAAVEKIELRAMEDILRPLLNAEELASLAKLKDKEKEAGVPKLLFQYEVRKTLEQDPDFLHKAYEIIYESNMGDPYSRAVLGGQGTLGNVGKWLYQRFGWEN